MRIAMLTDLPFWYTDTMYLSELEKRMPAAGISPKIFVIKSSGILGKIDATTGIMRFLSTVNLIEELSKFDVIHVHFTFPLGSALAILSSIKLLKKPFIIHIHGYDVFSVPSINYGLRRNRIGRIIAHYAWNKANRIIVNCKAVKSEIKNDGIRDDKIDLVYNGIDETLFSKTAVPEELSTLRQDNDLIFLNVASLVPVKNQIRLSKAFGKITEKYGSKYKIKLVLIGDKHMYPLSEMQRSNVIFLDKKNHSELKYYYSFADTFVLPSLSETNSWSMLEAMACELPVIASDVGGLGEILEDRKFLFNPLDLNDISKKIESIIEMNDGERRKVGMSNRKKVLDHYTLQRHITELKDIYEKVFRTDDSKC